MSMGMNMKAGSWRARFKFLQENKEKSSHHFWSDHKAPP
jgi:hypothetical protein